MLCTFKFARDPVLTFDVARLAETIVHPALEGLVKTIECFCAEVEIQPVTGWVGQAACHLIDQLHAADRPVRGDTARATKDVRIFADGIQRDQAAHARAHHECVRRIGQGVVLPIDKRLELFDEKFSIRIRDR